ncbi:hypothetical protein BGP75_11560 [Motiliproteus sp. MSK22-1]|nr:hypothetical protein BGP75_11560 [Motiliproteus sp. MSK22-1]
MAYGFLFSLIVLYADYRRSLKAYQASIDHVIATTELAAIDAVFTLDEIKARSIVKGLVRNNVLSKARLTDDFGGELAVFGEEVPISSYSAASRWLFGYSQKIAFKLLQHREKGDVNVGELVIWSNTESTYNSFISRAGLILLAVMTNCILVGIVLLYVSHKTVTSKVKKIAEDLAGVDPEAPSKDPIFLDSGRYYDEISLLGESANQLINRLGSSIQLLRQAQLAREESEILFQAVFNQTYQFICILDTRGRLLEVNSAMMEVFQAEPNAVLGKPFREGPWCDSARTVQQFEQAIADANRGNFVRFEVSQTVASGAKMYVDISLKPVRFREDQIEFLILEGRNITHLHDTQKELEKAYEDLEKRIDERTLELKQSEARYRDIVEASSDWFWETDVDGRYVYVGDKFLDLAGVPSSRVIGHRRGDFLSPEDLARDVKGWSEHRQQQQNRQLIRFTYTLTRPDGAEASVEINGKPFYNEQNEFLGYRGAGRDVTRIFRGQRELAEAKRQAEKASEAKSQFLSSMSHELRTPLNAILGFAQLMCASKRDPISDKQRQYVNQISHSGKHLLALINEVLDLAKIESGTLTLSMEELSAEEVVQECISSVSHLADHNDITITYQQPDATLPLVHADYTRFKQVLLNLLSNAVKYNRPGGSVTLSLSAATADRVSICVSDSGAGLTPEQVKQLFVPFNRLGAEISEIEGTGIGLTITKQLVERMGGKIQIQSTEGTGTQVYVELKAIHKVVTVPSIPLELEQFAEALINPGLILYVEDNPANLKLIEESLELVEGVRLISALNAEDGLAIASLDQPDLILMDINLPGMDGYEALKQLRANPVTRNIPVMALTANASDADIKKGMEAGFDAYITKPIDIEALLQEISKHLRVAL